MPIILQNEKRYSPVISDDIKALPTTDTASGSVATFETDMTENLVSCVCQLPYMASGYNDITVYHNSINIWNEQYESGTFDQTTGAKITSSSLSRSVSPIKVEANTSYYFVRGIGSGRIFYYDSGMSLLSSEYIGNGQVITTPNNCAYINFAMQNALYTGAESFNYPSTDTQYHAFNGVYTEFPSVIYGGTFEAISGTLTSTYESDGTEKVTPDIIRCNGGQIIALDNETNNIYNDCGDTEVKFILSVGKKIS